MKQITFSKLNNQNKLNFAKMHGIAQLCRYVYVTKETLHVLCDVGRMCCFEN